MIKNFATYISKIILVAIFVILSFSQKELYGAKETGVERIRECKAGGEVGDFEEMLYGKELEMKVGKEMDYDLSNPFCLGQFAGAYAIIKAALAIINLNCGTGSPFPRLLPSLPKDLIEISKASIKASKDRNSPCAGAVISQYAVIAAAIGQVKIWHEVAKEHYKKVRVCGSDWKGPDRYNYTMVSGKKGSYSADLKECVGDKLRCGKFSSINDVENNESDEHAKKYREWFYGGKEFVDAPAEGKVCKDPFRNDKPQRYYLKGLSTNYMCEKYNPSYHNDKTGKYKEAYDCCLERSQNYICLEKVGMGAFSFDEMAQSSLYLPEYAISSALEGLGVSSIYSHEHIFCKGDSKCTFKNNIAVSFATYRRDNKRLICAKSYSLCPFNFAVGGGSTYPDYFLDVDKNKKPITEKMINQGKALAKTTTTETPSPCENAESRNSNCSFNGKLGKLKNYCQYFQHCTTTNSRPYVANFDILNAYYSKACIDFVGDSQNGVKKVIDAQTGVSYNGGFLFGEQTNFSAPIVQCFKETMKNIFTNTAGHSRCLNGSFGNSKNECKDSYDGDSYFTDGNFIWKKGNKVKENSLFEMLQKRLKMIITAVLVISVTFFGFKILLGKLDLSNKKEILVYIIKIAFVIYFVNGAAWKDIFFDGIYNGSSEISKIFFTIRSSSETDNQCNFGSQYDKEGLKKVSTVSYPKGSEYLMVWDTLDCKIMQYLNYGPGFTTTTVVLLIIAAFFTGGIGLIIALSVFIMAICLIVATIRAMHIFISSAIAIIIYIFVSPIIIPLVLFEKTKNIFDAWLTQLMSFSLSPIVLFAYLAIFISLSEDIMYGGAKGFKDGRVDCSEYCLNKDGEKVDKNKLGNCDKSSLVNPLDNSVACLLSFNDFGKDEEAGFALFGIALPSIGKLLEPGKVETRVLLILKSALFLFILAQFMDEIPSVIARLTGEVIDVKSTGYIDVMKKFTSTMRGVQKRGARLVKGAGLAQLNNAKKEASKNKGDAKDDEGGGGDGDGDGGGGGNSKGGDDVMGG